MPTVLFVHHTPSPTMHTLFEAARAGATDPELAGIDLVVRPALGATPSDVLAADAYILGTTANFGYMSGALKHFFDTVYYPCLDATAGRPYGLYVHGNNDVEGAVRAVETIVRGLRWRQVVAPLEMIGDVSRNDVDGCRELAATVAATLLLDS